MKWVAGLMSCALVDAVAVVGFRSYDVRQDRKHVVTVKSQTRVFAGFGNGLCEGQRLTVVQPGAILQVRRIRYWKNCATLDVVLPDARHGYLVLGDSEVTVSPPLP
jgi:hypothetical protein